MTITRLKKAELSLPQNQMRLTSSFLSYAPVAIPFCP